VLIRITLEPASVVVVVLCVLFVSGVDDVVGFGEGRVGGIVAFVGGVGPGVVMVGKVVMGVVCEDAVDWVVGIVLVTGCGGVVVCC
jgi:hypothetical protein